MSQENVDTIRRGYEAFGRRDLDVALEMADPAIEAHDPVEMPDAAIHRGKAAVKRDWEQTLELFDDFAIDIEEVFDAGEEVVLFLRYRGRGKESGVAVEVVVNVSSPESETICLSQPPGTITLFSWLWRPWPSSASNLPVCVSR